MNIIDLETPKAAEKYFAPQTDNKQPFYISEYGKTHIGTPCYQLRIHSHISCIQYCISGSGVLIYDQKIYTVRQGDTFILREGKDQIYYSNPDNHFERIWINFRGTLADNILDTYGLYGTVLLRNTDSLRLLQELQTVCKANTDPEKYKKETAVAFLRLVQFLSENTQNTADVSGTVDEIRLYLDFHIMENIRLDDLARRFSYSKEHIIRVFKKTYGITPHQYIIQSKIRIAMVMLTTTDDTVREISEKLNFSDPHHFSETFKIYVGVRPTEYKKASRN